MSWYVYLMRCADLSYYAGITTDPVRRLLEHNQDNKLGAKYTRARRPVEIVYFEACDSRSEAATREYEIRKLSRSKKHQLAVSMLDQLPNYTSSI